MLKAYYYVLFRIFNHNRNTDMPLFKTVCFSTLLIWLLLLILSGVLGFFIDIKIIESKLILMFILAGIALINYLVFIRPMEFLSYNFKKDQKGGIIITIGILLLISIFIVFAQYNRERISNQLILKGNEIGNVSN